MKVWIFLALMCLVGGCSKDGLAPLSTGSVILAFGDSLTAGKGVPESQAYPAVLEQLTGFRVVNAGVSGETTAEGLARLDSVLQAENPSLVILFEGGNDILRNMDLSKTKENLDDMIVKIKRSGAQVVLVGLPHRQLFSNTAEFYQELADLHELPLQEKIVAQLLRKSSMKSDAVHFNAKGYAALAEAVAAMLRDTGAVR